MTADEGAGGVVCGDDAVQRLVVKRDGWWVVQDQRTREALSGGFKRKSEAVTEARRLAADEGAGGAS